MDQKPSLRRNPGPGRGTARGPAPANSQIRLSVVLTALGAGVLLLVVIFLLRSPITNSENLVPDASISDPVTVAGEPEANGNQGQSSSAQRSTKPAATLEDQWGIKITGMRVAMGGNGLDMRYQVIDPAKATSLLHMEGLTFVIDESTGRALPLPFQRENQTSQKLVAGKTYFALLSNKGQVVKSGSKVTVAIGNVRERNVSVD